MWTTSVRTAQAVWLRPTLTFPRVCMPHRRSRRPMCPPSHHAVHSFAMAHTRLPSTPIYWDCPTVRLVPSRLPSHRTSQCGAGRRDSTPRNELTSRVRRPLTRRRDSAPRAERTSRVRRVHTRRDSTPRNELTSVVRRPLTRRRDNAPRAERTSRVRRVHTRRTALSCRCWSCSLLRRSSRAGQTPTSWSLCKILAHRRPPLQKTRYPNPSSRRVSQRCS